MGLLKNSKWHSRKNRNLLISSLIPAFVGMTGTVNLIFQKSLNTNMPLNFSLQSFASSTLILEVHYINIPV
jgi:hypothetical protein